MRRFPIIAGLAALLACAGSHASECAEPNTQQRHDILRVFDSPALSPAINPTLTTCDSELNFLAATSGSIYLDDSEKLLDELQGTIDLAAQSFANASVLLILPGQQQALIDQLKKMDGRVTGTDLGIQASVAVPGENYGLQLLANVKMRGAGTFIYDNRDELAIQLAPLTLTGLAELYSHVDVSIVNKAEIGLNYSRYLSSDNAWKWGATIKAQNVSLVERSIRLEDYDEDKLFNRDRDVNENYYGNVDLGISWEQESVRLFASATDLIPGNFKGPLGSHYHLRPQLKLGADYRYAKGAAELRYDATPDRGFGYSDDLKTASLGANYDILDKLNIGLGYHYIQKGDYDDSVEAKVRYHLDYLYVELSARYASARELGGGLKIQLMF